MHKKCKTPQDRKPHKGFAVVAAVCATVWNRCWAAGIVPYDLGWASSYATFNRGVVRCVYTCVVDSD